MVSKIMECHVLPTLFETNIFITTFDLWMSKEALIFYIGCQLHQQKMGSTLSYYGHFLGLGNLWGCHGYSTLGFVCSLWDVGQGHVAYVWIWTP